MNSRISAGLLIAWAAVLGGCKPESENTAAQATRQDKPVVYTTFYPTAYFAERIGGDLIRVENPCPPDSDPATWMPGDDDIAHYQQADLIVINGAAFEKWPAQVSLPESRVVDTAEPLADELIVMEHAVTHSHGPAGAHTHEGIDGHTWLDPHNAQVQAAQIRDALSARLPAHQATLEANYQALVADLEALSARLEAVSALVRGKQLFAAHPAYNYLARRYGWQVRSFAFDPLTVPDEDALAQLAEAQAKTPGVLMLWESKPLRATEELLQARFGLHGVVYSPVEALDAEAAAAGADFVTLMNANVDRLESALTPSAS